MTRIVLYLLVILISFSLSGCAGENYARIGVGSDIGGNWVDHGSPSAHLRLGRRGEDSYCELAHDSTGLQAGRSTGRKRVTLPELSVGLSLISEEYRQMNEQLHKVSTYGASGHRWVPEILEWFGSMRS